MATTQQFYRRQAVTSTASVEVTFGFRVREMSVENVSTAGIAYCRFDGATATSTNGYPLDPGDIKTFRNLASSHLQAIASAGTVNLDIFGLQ